MVIGRAADFQGFPTRSDVSCRVTPWVWGQYEVTVREK
jgi:hypothetical protein